MNDNTDDDDDDLEVIREEAIDETRDIWEEGRGNTDMEDSPGEDSHDFQISGGYPNCDCTLLAGSSKGAKSSSSGEAPALKGPGTQGDTKLQATGDSAASQVVSQLGTTLGAATQFRAGSTDSRFRG